MSEGESAIPSWFVMTDDRRAKEAGSKELYQGLRDDYTEQLKAQGYDGFNDYVNAMSVKVTGSTPPPVAPPHVKQPEASKEPIINSGVKRRLLPIMVRDARYKAKRDKTNIHNRGQRKRDVSTLAGREAWAARKWSGGLQTIPETQHDEQFRVFHNTYVQPTTEARDDTQREFMFHESLEGFKEMFHDEFRDAPREMGEPSIVSILHNLIHENYDFIPKGTPLDELVPAHRIKGSEGAIKSMLENLSPSLRQRADPIHNLVNEPVVEAYLQRHHTVTSNVATDPTGHLELHNDWSLPYVEHLDQVKYNGVTHHQMSFGVAEGV